MTRREGLQRPPSDGTAGGADVFDRLAPEESKRDVERSPSGPRLGYLVKAFPRISETFITHLHAGFVHAPASVAWLTHITTGMPFSVATRAKDLYAGDAAPLIRRFTDDALRSDRSTGPTPTPRGAEGMTRP